MLRKVHKTIAPYKGLNTTLNPMFIEEGESPELQNVEFWGGALRSGVKFSSWSNAASGNPRVLCALNNENGNNVVLITHTGVYRGTNAPNLAFSLVGDYLGTSWRHVSTLVSLGKLLFTDGENYPMKYDGSANPPVPLGDLQTMNIRAKHICEYFSHYILGYTVESGVECPQRLRWSNIGDMDDWDSGTAGFMDLVDTPDEITGMCVLQNKLVVFKRNSVWDISYVGYPRMFVATPIIPDIGCIAPASICVSKGVVYFVGLNGIYAYDGSSVKSISDKMLNLFAYNLVDRNRLHLATGVFVENIGEYWVMLPKAGESLSTFYRYSIITGGWYLWSGTEDDFGCLATIYKPKEVTRWVDLAGKTWVQLAGKSWVDLSPNYPELVVAAGIKSSSGETSVFKFSLNTFTDDWHFCTKDFAFGSGPARVLKLMFEYVGNINLVVQYSTDGGASWKGLIVKQLASVDWEWLTIPMNAVCNSIMFKFTDTSANNPGLRAIRNIQIEFTEKVRYVN